MRRAARLWWVFAFMLAAAGPAAADIDISEYEPPGALGSARQRAQMREGIAADIEAERRRAEQQAERERREREAGAAREARRPYAERLTEQRCTACHTARNFADVRHTWLGWRLVVARMVWLNGAPIPLQEQSVITGHLAASRPADSFTRVIENWIPLLLVAIAASTPVVLGRLRARRREPRRQA